MTVTTTSDLTLSPDVRAFMERLERVSAFAQREGVSATEVHRRVESGRYQAVRLGKDWYIALPAGE